MRGCLAGRLRFADASDLPAVLERIRRVVAHRLPFAVREAHVQPPALEVLLDLLEAVPNETRIAGRVVAGLVRRPNVFVAVVGQMVGVLKERAEEAVRFFGVSRLPRIVLARVTGARAGLGQKEIGRFHAFKSAQEPYACGL